jgi:hypothetical protein
MVFDEVFFVGGYFLACFKYREYPPTIKNNSYGSILLVWKNVQITLV